MLPESDHQHQGRRDHASMRDVVLEVRVARKMLRQVGRQQGLDRAGQAPEVRHLGQRLPTRPQGERRDEDRNVAELEWKRKCHLGGLAAAEEEQPPAHLVDHQHGRENLQPGAGPRACADHEKDRRQRDDDQGDDVLGREKVTHTRVSRRTGGSASDGWRTIDRRFPPQPQSGAAGRARPTRATRRRGR